MINLKNACMVDSYKIQSGEMIVNCPELKKVPTHQESERKKERMTASIITGSERERKTEGSLERESVFEMASLNGVEDGIHNYIACHHYSSWWVAIELLITAAYSIPCL